MNRAVTMVVWVEEMNVHYDFCERRIYATPNAIPKTINVPVMPAIMVANASFVMPGKT